jgi:transcriptional regulator with XRE-family HTH domain
MELGARIKARRDELKWTQDYLAGKAGISKGFLSDLENGKRGVSAENLLDIARVLNVTLDYLMTGEEAEQPTPKDIEIPASLAEFADREGLGFRKVMMLLKMRQQILAHRSTTDRGPGDNFDWQKFYESVRAFL